TAGTTEIDGVTIRHGLDGGLGGGGIHNGGTLTATDLVLENNGTSGQGGGLFNEGTAYLTQSVLQNNMAAAGGGVSNTGSISFLGSFTIDGNTSTAEGGAVRNDGIASLDNMNPPVPPGPPTGGGTISSNQSGTNGGGIYNTGVISLQNVALDGNGAAADGGALWNNGSGDVTNGTLSRSTGTPTVAGDLPNADPLLGPLQNNPPGPSFLETRVPLAGSPAIDAAAGCPPPATDERGVARPQGAACDIGAVEVSAVTPT